MSTKLEELEKRCDKEQALLAHLDRYCCSTACRECVLNDNPPGTCGRKMIQKIQNRIEDLELEIRNERNHIKAIEEVAKTREEMTKAMLSVKRDDWDIVNISYAEDDTTAVAFIKKGTELKPNMEPLKEKTQRERIFELAHEIAIPNVCRGLICEDCPMHLTRNNYAECIKPSFRARLRELGEETHNA